MSVKEIRVGFLLDCCMSRRLRWHCGCHPSTDGVSLVHQYKKALMVSISVRRMSHNEAILSNINVEFVFTVTLFVVTVTTDILSI